MKIASLRQKKYSAVVFTRISPTEGQINNFDQDGSSSNSYSVVGTALELDTIETLYKQMAEIHSAEEPKFVTVSSAFAVANTVMVESPPISEVRPVAAKNALAAPNKGLAKRVA